jgi:Mg-chelatase subunit ChlD
MLALSLSSGCGSDDKLTGDEPPTSQTVGTASADAGAGGNGNGNDAGKGGATSTGVDAGKGTATAAKPDAALSTAEPDNCGKSGFSTGSASPDMMIVLDRSGSMKPNGGDITGLRCDNVGLFDLVTANRCDDAGIDCTRAADKLTVNCGGTQASTKGPVDRWDPSVKAIETLTTQFDATVNFGLMTFPASSNQCGPGDLQVDLGPGTASMIKSVLDKTQPGGGTPTGETLQAALKYFQDHPSGGADTVAPPRFVLLVTDGQPTCPNANGGGGGRGGNQLTADLKFTTDALDALTAEGIKTFVIGYDAALDATFASALTSFAQHGGTDNYYAVQNEDSLSMAFQSISRKVVTCDFVFKTPITDPRLVHVTLDGNTLRPDDPSGWTLAGDVVTVQGDSCAALQTGAGHRVEIVLECEPVVYL